MATLPATPAELALHRNFLDSVQTAKKGILRASFYLAELVDRKVHKTFGYASGVEYAIAQAGLTRGQASDLLRMGRRLQALPQTARAVADGSLTWSQARRLIGKLTPENECEALAAARAEPEPAPEARATPPRNPSEPVPPAPSLPPKLHPQPTPKAEGHVPTAGRHIVSLSFDDEGYALWEAAIAQLRKSGRREALATLHLRALQCLAAGVEPEEPQEPSALLVLLECPTCGRAAINTSRGELPAPRPLLEAAHCDAVIEHNDASRRAIIPPKLRRTMLRKARYRCQAPGCEHTRNLQLHHRIPHSHGGRTEASNLIVLCYRCHRALHEREEQLRAAKPPV